MTKTDQTNKRPKKRPSKKTEMLEVRISPEEKTAFLEACRKVGRSASAVIRDAMRAYANFGPMARLPGSPIMIVSAFVGAALGAFTLIQITQAAAVEPEERLYGMQIFSRLDLNSDRNLTFEEYVEADRTARYLLLNPNDGNPLTARSAGMIGGLLIAKNMDPIRLSNAPETISEACWDGINAYYLEHQDQRFNHWDKNQDNLVTAEEFSLVSLAWIQFTFAIRDLNADGVISSSDTELLIAEGRSYEPRSNLGALRVSALGERMPFETNLSIACETEIALPRMMPDYEAGSEAQTSRYREAASSMDAFQDYDRDGVVTFEEYAAFSGL